MALLLFMVSALCPALGLLLALPPLSTTEPSFEALWTEAYFTSTGALLQAATFSAAPPVGPPGVRGPYLDCVKSVSTPFLPV